MEYLRIAQDLEMFGVNYFKGTYFYCHTDHLWAEPLLSNKWDCLNSGGEWLNHFQNFDNIGNAMLALLYRMSGDVGGELPLPAGGVGGLVHALASAAESQGVEMRTDSPVARAVVEDRRVTGVELASGETFSAATVVSNADPKTSFFKLVGARHFDIQFTHRINRLRNEGFVAKVHSWCSI